MAAAVDLDLTALSRLEHLDFFGHVALSRCESVPGERVERPWGDELPTSIERGRDLVGRIGGLGPGPREDLGSLAASAEAPGSVERPSRMVERRLPCAGCVLAAPRRCRRPSRLAPDPRRERAAPPARRQMMATPA